MRIELLIDAPDFWERLREDMAGARESVVLQTFSFEGDRVGRALGRALQGCRASDRRLLVDSYSLIYHSDRIVPGPAWFDPGLRREFHLTKRWVDRLRRDGAGVRFGNPLGPSPTNIVRRSHKKLAVIDGRISYLGGINFSDHNFEWHDMMFRVESEELGRLLIDDFEGSWRGEPQPLDRMVGAFRILSLNGRGNPRGMEPVLGAIAGARTSIDVVSAYLSYPFTHYLGEAAARGVRVRVLTPADNNKPNLWRHVMQSSLEAGFEVYEYPGGMSHLKAMVIDGETLVAGSTNFDFMSFHILEELLFMSDAPEVVRPFRDRVWRPDLAKARRVRPARTLSGRMGHAAVLASAGLAGLLALPS